MQFLHQKHSKNYDLRPSGQKSIKYIIIHYTELNFEDSVDILCSEKSKVSCHYLIDRDGSLYQLVGDFYRAWHAGVSKWQNDQSLNDISLGIELVNSGSEDFTREQMDSLEKICMHLTRKYTIPKTNILAHSDIAPSRKIDPGIFFNWQKFLEKGFGIKFRKKNGDIKKIKNLQKDQIIRIKSSLRKIGYSINNNDIFDKEFSDVIRAFQLHFSPESINFYGGIDYIKNLENIFEWDEQSDLILQNII